MIPPWANFGAIIEAQHTWRQPVALRLSLPQTYVTHRMVNEEEMGQQFGRPTLWNGLKRGFRRTCPRCGRGRMFAGYLTAKESCENCGLAFEPLRADDAPAYFTISIVGHIVVSGYLVIESTMHPPVWLQLSIWMPGTLAMTLGLLPFIKGAIMGAIFSSQAKRGRAA